MIFQGTFSDIVDAYKNIFIISLFVYKVQTIHQPNLGVWSEI